MTNPQEEPLPRLPPRRDDAHKGDFGLALIVGGSRGMAGAAALAGLAALRGGAGLVRLAVPETVLDTVAGFEPSYMTVPLPADKAGRIAAGAFDRIVELTETATAIACGPGLGRSFELDQIVVRLYQEIAKPMVFDADALNALAAESDVLAHPGGPRILTPHPGEFARLIRRKLEGEKTGTGSEPSRQRRSGETGGGEVPVPVLSPRQEAAVQLAARCGIVVVLKGHRTLVTDGNHRPLNSTGNPGMATGGSGDVLTGLTTALVCQKMTPFDAARLAVHLHGLAGDLAAEELGQVSIIASDLIQYLPEAFQALQ
jgi:ADP-dependent NAD(P)H-hydrate dehydratase